MTSIKNFGIFPVGTRVIGAAKSNPVKDVAVVIENREDKAIVRWEGSGHEMFIGHADLNAAAPDDAPFEGTIEEWHAENERRQVQAVRNYMQNHVCTEMCRRDFRENGLLTSG